MGQLSIQAFSLMIKGMRPFGIENRVTIVAPMLILGPGTTTAANQYC